ncbi:hypothetical protein KDX31_09275 [Amphritea atlantica]|uniref:Uncharacterized protein n=1 Tax=Amphritea atlantica TaxID=355243 RepID=A0ABY5GYR2_9GAMM|nr:hypothetical protein KDX31_09275 [Amphritea atlantica]
MFNETFKALIKEAQFTKEILGAGATQIRNANYSRKGVYFQSFTSLSTGLERIGKLCLMLDYYIDNDGDFPDFKYLKNDIGHKIDVLYKKSITVKQQRGYSFRFLDELDGGIHQNILNVISDFAKGDRYSNINILVNSKQKGDPVSSWYTTVDKPLFDLHVSDRKKKDIAHNARVINQMAGHLMMVRHTSETGEEISDVEDASSRTGVQEAVAPYRQLYVIHIIRFWVELLGKLQREAMSLNNDDIPYFSEIFAGFYNQDSYIRTRKTWDTI